MDLRFDNSLKHRISHVGDVKNQLAGSVGQSVHRHSHSRAYLARPGGTTRYSIAVILNGICPMPGQLFQLHQHGGHIVLFEQDAGAIQIVEVLIRTDADTMPGLVFIHGDGFDAGMQAE